MTAESGSHVMTVLPLFQRQGSQIDGTLSALLPWGAPYLILTYGLSPPAPVAEPVITLGYEWPIPTFQPTSPPTKQELEWLHLARFTNDHRMATGVAPYTRGVQSAKDARHDFQVDVDGRSVGLDCAAFTVENRRNAQALFARLRQRMRSMGSEPFKALRGFMIYLWIPVSDGMELPFRRDDSAAVEDLVAALKEYNPDVDKTSRPDGILPEVLGDFGMTTTASGRSTFCAVPFTNSAPDTFFMGTMGFEIGFAFTTEHTATTAGSELQRLITQHDNAETQWLLVSAGAPDKSGVTFPSEESIARFVLEHPLPIAPPRFIERVTLHFWSSGEAIEVYPGLRRIFGPMFEAVVPAHRPFADPAK